jgi:hypothetical protein
MVVDATGSHVGKEAERLRFRPIGDGREKCGCAWKQFAVSLEDKEKDRDEDEDGLN